MGKRGVLLISIPQYQWGIEEAEGKDELLLISSTLLNDTVQITETPGEGEGEREEGQMEEVWAAGESRASQEVVFLSRGVMGAQDTCKCVNKGPSSPQQRCRGEWPWGSLYTSHAS